MYTEFTYPRVHPRGIGSFLFQTLNAILHLEYSARVLQLLEERSVLIPGEGPEDGVEVLIGHPGLQEQLYLLLQVPLFVLRST